MSAFIRLLVAFLVAGALCSAAKTPFKANSNLKGSANVNVKGSIKPTVVKGAPVKPVAVTVSKPVYKSAVASKSTQKNGAVNSNSNSNLYGNLLTKYEEKPLILSSVKKVPVAETESETYNTDYKTTIGVTPPIGFFDPLGLLKNPAVSEERFQRLRQTEIKHGRIYIYI